MNAMNKTAISPKKETLELNGVALAILLLETREGEQDVEAAIDQLRIFCDYVGEHMDTPIFWHDFLKKRKV